jgi:4'-phosphopantetheinyl transferase EntD
MIAGRIAALFPTDVAVCVADPAMYHGLLFAAEAALIAGAVAKRRQEFTAGRHAARAALARLGTPPGPLLQTSRRAPAWPEGTVGSITHCQDFCCAVATRSDRARSLGVDAEASDALDDRLAALVCGPAELAHFMELPHLRCGNWPKLAFSAKEAFYKCVDPLLGELLEFDEVAVRFAPDPSGDRGAFAIGMLRPGLATTEGPLPTAGRWAIDDDRVYAGMTWLPPADHTISRVSSGMSASHSTILPASRRTTRSAVLK